MKLKHIPNAITISRFIIVTALIVVSIVFWNTDPYTGFHPAIVILFVLAGATDMIDGPIARRIKDARSELGAELDSMADMFLVLVSVFCILPQMDVWSWLWPGIIAVLVFKLCSAIPGIIKHKKVFFLHSLTNKLLGLFLFIGGIFYFIFGGYAYSTAAPATWVNHYIVFLIVIVFLITLEEIIIISTLDYPAKDIRGFWQVRKVNAEYRATGEKLDLKQNPMSKA